MSEQNSNRRYVAKIKKMQGKNGSFQKILVDNPKPTKQDGSQDPYHKGVFIWCDNETGKKFLVKSLGVKGVSAKQAEHGFIGSICIDLDNSYDVEDLG